MTVSPEISVIVPVYNAEALLQRCVKSILCQSYTDFELLLINDGSTDRSGQLCDELRLQDNRIHTFHQQNQGVSAARNAGISRASGKYIVFVDSDDWVKENYLSHLLSSATGKEGRGLVIQGFLIYKPEGCLLDGTKSFIPAFSTSAVTIGRMVEAHNLSEYGCPYSKLYDRSLLVEHSIRFDKRTNFGEDLLFMFDYLMHADYLLVDSPQEYVYIKYPSSLSSSFHSFEMEYFFFLSFLKRIERLSVSSNIALTDYPQTMKAVMVSFQRALKTDYQAYHRDSVSLKERLEHLKTLVKEHKTLLQKFYYPECKSDRLGKVLLLKKYFALYDLYVRFIMWLNFIPMFGAPIKAV